jgi:1-aminocyclopropane-1-carboxylate deaminase/D-cysteine desulfhydrase-like pyridoxal-dependent ACC family enzyme
MRGEMISTKTQSFAARLDAVPRVKCGFYPTPLEELTRFREKIGANCPRLFIKRDDFTGAGFGSNKLRKLDYAVAREIERGTKTIVTIAGEKSNHARVTAAVCARFGLRCVLVLSRAAPGSIPEGFISASRFVYEMLDADVRWVSCREEREPTALALVEEMRAAGEKAAYLPLGVSFPLGALGFVQAIRETNEQFDALGTRPNYIFHASTSGGTQAGIIAGCRIFGDPKTKVVGVSPDDSTDEIARRVAEIVNGVYRQLGIFEPEISAGEVTVLDNFIGDGYGIETRNSKDAARLLAATEGIILDPTYTSKAMAALIDWIKIGKLTAEDTVLFWHTGGHLGYFYAPLNGNQLA